MYVCCFHVQRDRSIQCYCWPLSVQAAACLCICSCALWCGHFAVICRHRYQLAPIILSLVWFHFWKPLSILDQGLLEVKRHHLSKGHEVAVPPPEKMQLFIVAEWCILSTRVASFFLFYWYWQLSNVLNSRDFLWAYYLDGITKERVLQMPSLHLRACMYQTSHLWFINGWKNLICHTSSKAAFNVNGIADLTQESECDTVSFARELNGITWRLPIQVPARSTAVCILARACTLEVSCSTLQGAWSCGCIGEFLACLLGWTSQTAWV